MSVYHYVKRTGPDTAGPEAPSAVDVTLTNPDFKAELDRTMDRMGFEFAGSRDDHRSAVAPGFPASSGHAFPDTSDRPTPVAGLPRVAPVHPAVLRAVAESPAGRDLDMAALGIAPSWEGLPEAPLPAGGPEPKPALPFVRFLPKLRVDFRRWVWVAAAVVPVLIVHGGMLGAAPSADDYLRLYDGAANGFVNAVLKQEGVHSLPVNRLLVWVLHRLFSLRSGLLFLLPFALHLTCVALLRKALLAVTERAILSTAVAVAWGISPLHRGTLSEIYSLGTIVSSVCGLVVLTSVIAYDERVEPVPPLRVVGWTALLVLGALSSSTGTAFALAMPLVVSLLVPRGNPARRAALGLLPAAVIALALYGAFRWFGPPEPLGKFVRGLPLFFELGVYGIGNFLVGPFVVVAPGGEPAALIGGPGPGAALIVAGVIAVFAAALASWAIVRSEPGFGRRAGAFAVLFGVAYLFEAFDAAKYVVRDGLAVLAVKPEPHYAALLGVALCVGSIARAAKPLSFRQPFIAPALLGSSALFATLLAWAAASHVADSRSSLEKGKEDVERALERAVGATEQGHDAYLENVEFPVVPRAAIGRDRARFPGLLAYFALAHPSGELAGRTVRFVEDDAKLVAAIREKTVPRIAALVESADEAKKQGHAVTTPRLSRPAGAAPEAPASARRPARSPTIRERKRSPPAKP